MDRMTTRKTEQGSRVKIYAPDMSLQKKIGNDLDQILTTQAIAHAEMVIAQSSDQFLEEALLSLKELVKLDTEIQDTPQTALSSMPLMIEHAFAIKVQAGQGGYGLVAALAKSLQLHCEKITGQPAGKDIKIIHWHVVSMQYCLRNKISGDGGQLGKVILDELKQLHAVSLA